MGSTHRVTNCVPACLCYDAFAHSWTYASSKRLNLMISWRSLSSWTILCLLLIVANITWTIRLAGIDENLLTCLKVSSTPHLAAQSSSWGPDLPYRPLVSRAWSLKGSSLVISYCMSPTLLLLWAELASKAVWAWCM